MQFEHDFAQRFREAADVMRAIAAGETDVMSSGILDRIAAEYEHTAADLEALHRAHADAPVADAPVADAPVADGKGEGKGAGTRAA